MWLKCHWVPSTFGFDRPLVYRGIVASAVLANLTVNGSIPSRGTTLLSLNGKLSSSCAWQSNHHRFDSFKGVQHCCRWTVSCKAALSWFVLFSFFSLRRAFLPASANFADASLLLLGRLRGRGRRLRRRTRHFGLHVNLVKFKNFCLVLILLQL